MALNFFLEQLVGLLGKRGTHLLTHQRHARSEVRHRHLHGRRTVVERQCHPNAHFHHRVALHHADFTVRRPLPHFYQTNVLAEDRLVVFVKQRREFRIVHLVLHAHAQQIQDAWVGVLHLASHHQHQTHRAGLHQHPETFLGLKKVQFCPLPLGDVVDHQHSLVGCGVRRSRGLQVNLRPLLGDALKLHTRPRKLPGAQALPIAGVDHVEDVFSDGEFLPPKQDRELLVGIHNFRPFQKRNALHRMSGQGPEPLLALADDLLVHHALADVADLHEHLAIAGGNSLPLPFKHSARLATDEAAHFGRTALKDPLIFRLEQPLLVALQLPKSTLRVPNSIHPSLRRGPVQHPAGHGIPSHRLALGNQNHGLRAGFQQLHVWRLRSHVQRVPSRRLSTLDPSTLRSFP